MTSPPREPRSVAEDGPPTCPVLPISLFVHARTCLVVGGGKVATRKTWALLDAGAEVRVVSPVLSPSLSELAAEDRILHVSRRFEPSDVEDCCLVFAATDDCRINRSVLQAARAAHCLCCAADANWPNGDFLTPAVTRRNGVTVGISTGGRSCRQARLVKQTLGRHLDMIGSADLLVLGTSHACLSLAKREPFHLVDDRYAQTGRMIMQVWGVHEFMLLNTCNRIELAAIVSEETRRGGILERIMGFDRLPATDYYRHAGFDAFEHLTLVTAGLLSQSPGEYHVASQVKKALESGVQRGWANSMMKTWVSAALHISKHVKRDVTPGFESQEIDELALRHLPEEPGRALVIGTGTIGRRLIEKCRQKGYTCTWCYHHNKPRCDPRAAEHVTIVPWDEMKRHLATQDVILCAANAPSGVLGATHVPAFDAGRPVTLFDLGMPRNIDPALTRQLPRAKLLDLDTLKRYDHDQWPRLEWALTQSRELAHRHREQYDQLLTQFQGRNTTQ